MIDKITEASLLYDFYGQLLTERKQQVMRLYHEENLSLSEIAQEFGISRTAVHDSLKSAEKALNEYEKKLGLIAKFVRSRQVIDIIRKEIDSISEDYSEEKELVERLDGIKKVIDDLDVSGI